jgi:hypothetical protein
MANAKRVTAPVTVVPPDRIHLDLSLEEAEVIFDISGHIGGSPETTRRGLMDGIASALADAGVGSRRPRANDMVETLSWIYFKRSTISN